jgi:hypothetical protein
MADNHQLFMQELVSAKYFTEPLTSLEVATATRGVTAGGVPFRCSGMVTRRSNAERTFSWLSKLVSVALLVAAGAWLWLNQATLSTGASHLRQRTSSPFDFIVWLCGSKHTFKESLIEATSRPIPGLENMKAADSVDNFEYVDFSNLTASPAFQPADIFGPSSSSPTPSRGQR